MASRDRAPWALPPDHQLHAHLACGVPMASYRPVGSEADPSPIERLAAATQALTSYPRIDADGVMRFYSLGPSRALVHNPLGFDEPAADGSLSIPACVLVPLLAFDRRGTRLGQGGGHYDRALARLRGEALAEGWRLTTIGIAWSAQEMADLPREPWDIALDIVITELEWIVTS